MYLCQHLAQVYGESLWSEFLKVTVCDARGQCGPCCCRSDIACETRPRAQPGDKWPRCSRALLSHRALSEEGGATRYRPGLWSTPQRGHSCKKQEVCSHHLREEWCQGTGITSCPGRKLNPGILSSELRPLLDSSPTQSQTPGSGTCLVQYTCVCNSGPPQSCLTRGTVSVWSGWRRSNGCWSPKSPRSGRLQPTAWCFPFSSIRLRSWGV